jgi:gp16 family phage-associated protein
LPILTPPNMKTTASKTVPQFLDELAASDMTLAAWARKHNQCVTTVYMLCLGRVQGTRGKARRVARAMGLSLPPMRSSANQANHAEAA